MTIKFKLLDDNPFTNDKDPVNANVWALHFYSKSRTWVQKVMLKELRRAPVTELTGLYQMHDWWAWNGPQYSWWGNQHQEKHTLTSPVAYAPILVSFFTEATMLDAAKTMDILNKRFPAKIKWKPELRAASITPAGDFKVNAQFAKTA